MTYTLEIRDSLEHIACDEWNALSTDGNPFVRYEFLRGLEATNCLGADKGWYPRYFLLWQGDDSSDEDENDFGELVAAMPGYIKTHSYGEFVFDWAWADAFQRHGEDYYPKLVCAVPFTPATGPRLLIRHDQAFSDIADILIGTACQFVREQKFSSAHWLFTLPKDCYALCGSTERELPENFSILDLANKLTIDEKDKQKQKQKQKHRHRYEEEYKQDHDVENEVKHSNEEDDVNEREKNHGDPDKNKNRILRRMDCQYHWHNENYQSFEEFLDRCTAKRRKTLRRERRYVTDAGITLQRRSGSSLTEQEWRWVHEFYEATFEAKWGNPSLTESFFHQMGKTFGESTLIVFAYDPNDETPDVPVACSIMFHGGDCLYGRFWGCRKEHHCLHFEACYYQGIEHCIANNITRFEPGAQGEHKITRGFVPTITESAHYIAHPGFHDAIANYLSEEKKHVRDRCTGLTDLLPFKQPDLNLGSDANSVLSS